MTYLNKNYLQNLTKFVADVRQEIFDTSGTKFATKEDIPVVIVELGYWIYGLVDDIGESVIKAQNTFVQNEPNAIIVKSGAGSEQENLTAFYHYDAASILIVGLRIAKATANILKQNAERRL